MIAQSAMPYDKQSRMKRKDLLSGVEEIQNGRPGRFHSDE